MNETIQMANSNSYVLQHLTTKTDQVEAATNHAKNQTKSLKSSIMPIIKIREMPSPPITT